MTIYDVENCGLVIGIDASNLRQGGGVTHLKEILRIKIPEVYSIEKVIIWGGRNTLKMLERRPWIKKICPPEIDKSLISRMFWQKFMLTKHARWEGCDILFVPGGSYFGNFHPFVTMSQNLLPFELNELFRYRISLRTVRLLLLRLLQSKSFRNADGVIFLNDYARKTVLKTSGGFISKSSIIPHGTNSRFLKYPKEQKTISEYNLTNPFRLIYVSCVDQYKHQWHLVEAVARLRQEGLPLVLNLVGPAYPPALSRLKAAIHNFPFANDCVYYNGELPYEAIHRQYEQAEIGIFASSCENLPIILLEMMATGLPIACSNRGPMPELLLDGGVYFDPEQPEDISRVLRKLTGSVKLREEKAARSHQLAKEYSWKRCSNDTFKFLSSTANQYKQSSYL